MHAGKDMAGGTGIHPLCLGNSQQPGAPWALPRRNSEFVGVYPLLRATQCCTGRQRDTEVFKLRAVLPRDSLYGYAELVCVF